MLPLHIEPRTQYTPAVPEKSLGQVFSKTGADVHPRPQVDRREYPGRNPQPTRNPLKAERGP